MKTPLMLAGRASDGSFSLPPLLLAGRASDGSFSLPSLARPANRSRPGYTLLEILVATVISLLLMTGLYVAFDVTLSQTESGRAVVSESDFGRAVFNRMNLDLSLPMGLLPPKSGGFIEDTATATTPSTGGTTTPATGGTTGGVTIITDESTTTTPPDTPSAEAQSTQPADISMQAGVVGSQTQLTLFVSKVPTWLTDRSGTDMSEQQVSSDLRRIIYYIHSSGKGLCRQERDMVTADGIRNNFEPDRTTENEDLIAPEVVGVVFEYADGMGYSPSWDGSYSDDGVAVLGPPRAIRVTLTLEFPDDAGKTVEKKIQHVFSVRAAVGFAAPAEPIPVDPATTGGM